MGKTKKYCTHCDLLAATLPSKMELQYTSRHRFCVSLSLNKRKRWEILDFFDQSNHCISLSKLAVETHPQFVKPIAFKRKSLFERAPHCFTRTYPDCFNNVIHPALKKNRPNFIFKAATHSIVVTEDQLPLLFSPRDLPLFPPLTSSKIHFHENGNFLKNRKHENEVSAPFGFTFLFHYDGHSYSSNSEKACDYNMERVQIHADFCPLLRGLFVCTCQTGITHDTKIMKNNPNSIRVTVMHPKKEGKMFRCGKSRQRKKERMREKRESKRKKKVKNSL